MKASRAVIDTNVLISAALTPKGTASLVATYFLKKGRLIFSRATFAELETRLMRSKFDPYVTRELRAAILRDLGSVAGMGRGWRRGSLLA